MDNISPNLTLCSAAQLAETYDQKFDILALSYRYVTKLKSRPK